jgi:uroporphyrinogen III methyltransferase / synthase
MASLSNKRIVITRPLNQANEFAEAVRALGAIPILIPTIKITPMDDYQVFDEALKNLDTYDWVVLTSVHGVASMWDRLDKLRIDTLPVNLKIAAIGPKTADAITAHGISPDFIPEKYVLEKIVPGLGDIVDKKFLLARGNLARKVLPEMIESIGGIADDIVVYCTNSETLEESSLQAIRHGVDVITFTSPSIVENFISMVNSSGLSTTNLPGNPKFAYIGPITEQKAIEHQLPLDIVANEFTTKGLLNSIINYFETEKVITI